LYIAVASARYLDEDGSILVQALGDAGRLLVKVLVEVAKYQASLTDLGCNCVAKGRDIQGFVA
jgi:hypothetical protein